ncbi:MAG: XapX domain-containing protein [Bacillota bacterium]
MKEVFFALGTGLLVGMLFAYLKLPVPAPATLAGLAGVVGLFLGYMVAIKMGWGIK